MQHYQKMVAACFVLLPSLLTSSFILFLVSSGEIRSVGKMERESVRESTSYHPGAEKRMAASGFPSPVILSGSCGFGRRQEVIVILG